MVLTELEKEIKKYYNINMGHKIFLSPKEIKRIKDKRGLLKFLKTNVKNTVEFMYCAEICIYSYRLEYADEEELRADDFEFTGKWIKNP